jgi:hypothetical protein
MSFGSKSGLFANVACMLFPKIVLEDPIRVLPLHSPRYELVVWHALEEKNATSKLASASFSHLSYTYILYDLNCDS